MLCSNALGNLSVSEAVRRGPRRSGKGHIVSVFDHYKPLAHRDVRLAECRRITELMSGHRPFSFLRLGDMELTSLVSWQQGRAVPWEIPDEDKIVSSAVVFGHPGLTERFADRLQRAFERCSYLDYHDGWRINQRDLPQWRHHRDAALHRNPGPEVSQLFFDWAEHEFRRYVRGRRVMMAGAEAGLLKELYADDTYRTAARDYWPADAEVTFFPETRRNEQLDAIKSDLRDAITRERVDTVFLSLGGAAKIICYELAEELGICAFDFGSLMRALTYSGSDGHNFFRAVHYPFLFRVPFAVYMAALRRAMPSLTPAQLLAKAHAQLTLELIRKEVGWSYASERGGTDCLDFGPENMAAFKSAYDVYRREYRPLAGSDPDAARQVAEFDTWLGQFRIGARGRWLYYKNRARRAVGKAVRYVVGSRPH